MSVRKLQECEEFTAEDAVYIPPNARQYVHNCGNEALVFVCMVDPAWRQEDETLYNK